jgi:N-acetylmuramic acid 6-phosphate etherase
LAWTYLITPSSKDSAEAWQKVLGRAPRALPWPGFAERFGEASLAGFDFSPASAERRSRKAQSTAREITRYQIERAGSHHLALRIDNAETTIPKPESLLCEHLMLKIAMNISSTLTMGRLGRFSGNLMLYVRAANNKLVDRAIRYIRILLADANIRDFTYDDVCLALFAVTAEISVEEPAVWKTFEHLKARASGSSRVQ